MSYSQQIQDLENILTSNKKFSQNTVPTNSLSTASQAAPNLGNDSDQNSNFYHFYSYKGGQARTAFLAQTALYLSQNLAHKVLIIDLDFEAPSAHTVFGKAYSENYLSLADFFQPLVQNQEYSSQDCLKIVNRVWKNSDIHIIGIAEAIDSRLLTKENFRNSLSVNPGLLDIVLQQVFEFAKQEKFDSVLIDHSTGINPWVLQGYKNFPGNSILFAKLDNQWQSSTPYLSALLEVSHKSVFVSFDPHPRSASEALNDSRIREQLSEISDLVGPNALNDTIEEFLTQHVFWHYHSGYLSSLNPEISAENLQSIQKVVSHFELFRLDKQRFQLSSHGGKSSGKFVVTKSIQEVFDRKDENLVVLGRTGTGKTRLLKELSNKSIGFPLLTDIDSDPAGIYAEAFEVSGMGFRANNVSQFLDRKSILLRWTEVEAMTLLLEQISVQIPILDVQKKLNSARSQFSSSALDTEALRKILLDTFENKVKAPGSPTIYNFFRDYFSDEVSGSYGFAETNYNPRMLYFFCESLSKSITVNEKISGLNVENAHLEASKAYLHELVEEVTGMLGKKNKEEVERFFNALDGFSTPWKENDIEEHFKQKLSISGLEVSEFIDSLKKLGIITSAPGKKVSWWRASRLLRIATSMKINKSVSSAQR